MAEASDSDSVAEEIKQQVTCVICTQPLDNGQETVVQSQKGAEGIQKASNLRNHFLPISAGQRVHKECRHNYCNTNIIKRDLKRKHEEPATASYKELRSSKSKTFDFANDCLFCTVPVKDEKKKGNSGVFPVRTYNCQTKLELACAVRGSQDKWAEDVLGRIEYARELHAADAVYHNQCNVNFRTNRNIPKTFSSDKIQNVSKGRPEDPFRHEAFLKVVEFLEENDDEQTTVSDLCEKMREYLDEDVPYSEKHMKNKLNSVLGDRLIITSIQGKNNVVTFRENADKILDQFFNAPVEEDHEAQKYRLLETAARLILSDIQRMDSSKNTYPTKIEIASLEKNLSFLPASIKIFLQTILFKIKHPDIRICSLGQAMVQAARPKASLPPLQIGLAVQLHHLFGSKFLIEQLNKLGFCSSYNEVKRFEQCAATHQGTDLAGVMPDSSIQFVADNVDHNIRTLDGSGTFHGMGIIATATPSTTEHKRIPRDISLTAQKVSAIGRIPIHFIDTSVNDLSLSYQQLRQLQDTDQTKHLDLMWKLSWPLRSPRPGWSGMMQAVCKGKYPGKAAVTFLPMIDMDPTNLSCIYSTLRFVSSLADRYNTTPVITFDQPLWWKAQLIIDSLPSNSDLRSIVLRLGGFHTEMSFLGCVGHVMRGSGLQQALEVIFAPNAVVHMLSGKSVTRAVRGHFLADAVLNAILSSATFSFPLPTNTVQVHETENHEKESACEDILLTDTENVMDDSLLGETHHNVMDDNLLGETHQQDMDTNLKTVLDLFDQLLDGNVSAEELFQHEDLRLVEVRLLETKSHLQQNRTSRLWLQYMEMVDILRRFLKAERTGNWSLHIQSLQEMLPYLAASGHNMYTKSVHIYLQQMQLLQENHPKIYNEFINGYHVLRRSDRYWAGLSPDLIIEQVLMRSVKTVGGLTRGRGMGESQRTQWLLSMPACADMNDAMQDVTGSEFTTSDQHAEAGESRQKRDEKDMLSLLNFFLQRNPFDCDMSLRSVSTGLTADATVNADRAKEVGNNILKAMKGAAVREFKFKRKDQVITMDVKICAKVDGEAIQVDPQLLFQRLVTAANSQPEDFDLPSVFQYELSTPPPSLFESSGLMREANKASLLDALLKTVGEPPDPRMDTGNVQYVLDGGSLLHKIPWQKGETFQRICNTYGDYVIQRYNMSTVVFDGYEGPSTKDCMHLRRSFGVVGPLIKFSKDMVLSIKKDVFLSNRQNKQSFIHYLSDVLLARGCKIVHAPGDADNLIVQTAVSCSAETTVVIGEDTDLLVLLCFHTNFYDTQKKVLFRSDKKSTKQRVWDIRWLQLQLGVDVCHLLPFVHAIAGCDTTSRPYGIGKGVPLKKLATDTVFREMAHTFVSHGKSQEEITKDGEKALICLYNGRMQDSLDTLRYQRFCEKVSTNSTSVPVHSLPPTSNAAKYHCLRVYLQVQTWINSSCDLQPEQWGWHLSSGRLEARTTDLLPAPESLLRIIRCSCKRDCQSKRCTCRKHGLECSLACGECKGITCQNSSTSEMVDSLPDVAGTDSF